MKFAAESKLDSYQFLLDDARRRFDSWRKETGGGPGQSIPSDLWQIAINLLDYVPLSEVARTLGIDASRLRYKNEHGAAASDFTKKHTTSTLKKNPPKSTSSKIPAKKPEIRSSLELARVSLAEQPSPAPLLQTKQDNAVVMEIVLPSGVLLRLYQPVDSSVVSFVRSLSGRGEL